MPSSTFHLTADELFESVRALADALPADRQQLAALKEDENLHLDAIDLAKDYFTKEQDSIIWQLG